jgi:hypothetical protein
LEELVKLQPHKYAFNDLEQFSKQLNITGKARLPHNGRRVSIKWGYELVAGAPEKPCFWQKKIKKI